MHERALYQIIQPFPSPEADSLRLALAVYDQKHKSPLLALLPEVLQPEMPGITYEILRVHFCA